MAETLSVIKIGGNVIDEPEHFRSFLQSFAGIPGKKLLVHGGGKIATQIGNLLQIESKYIDGRRITDDQTIDLVTMVYGGLINRKAVALLQSFRCNALGIAGADGNLLPAKKRPVQQTDFGWVGDMEASGIPADRWRDLIDSGITLVVAPLTHDGKGHILNTNADTIAAMLAQALAPHFETSLIYCFERKGILADVEDEQSVLSVLDKSTWQTLRNENKLFAGILPKLHNAFAAREAGVNRVVIGHSQDVSSLMKGAAGTQIDPD